MSEEKNISSVAKAIEDKAAPIEEKKLAVAEAKASKAKKSEKKDETIDRDKVVPGMTVRVYQKIKEMNFKGEEKERLQYFEGMVIARKHGKEKGATITVRKISEGVAVEKIFPLNAPTIDRIEAKKQVKVRRAKLNFLRSKYTKKLKTRELVK